MGNRKGDRQGSGVHTRPPRTCEAAEMPTGKTPQRGAGEEVRKRAPGYEVDPCWADQLWGCGRGRGEGALHADRFAVPWWLVVRSRGAEVGEIPLEEL